MQKIKIYFICLISYWIAIPAQATEPLPCVVTADDFRRMGGFKDDVLVDDLITLFANKSPEWQAELSKIIKATSAPSWLWHGDLIKRLLPLSESDLKQMFTVIINEPLQALMQRAASDIGVLNIHEKRALILLLTQNWRLVQRVDQGTKWLRHINEFSVRKFYDTLYDSQDAIIMQQTTLVDFLFYLAKRDQTLMRRLKRENPNADMAEAILSSPHLDDLIVAMKKRLEELKKIVDGSTPLQRPAAYAQYALLEEHLRKLDPVYAQQLEETRTFMQSAKASFIARFLPASFRTLKRVLAFAVLAGAIFFAENETMNYFDNTRPVSVQSIAQRVLPGLAPAADPGKAAFDRLMQDHFSNPASQRMSDAQFKKELEALRKAHPNLGW